MTFRFYILIMSIASVSAWIGWIFVLNSIDPVHTGSLGFLLFYITLATALIGTISLIGAQIRIWFNPDEPQARLTVRSFRQALFLTTIFLIALWMQSELLLRWWSLILIIIGFSLLELLFVSLQKRS